MAVKKAVKPATPKLGEVGYKFKIDAEIIEVHPENDDYNYPVIIQLNVGSFEDCDNDGGGFYTFSYPSKQDFIDLVASTNPSIRKAHKQEEIKAAQLKLKQTEAEIARLTKELAEIK